MKHKGKGKSAALFQLDKAIKWRWGFLRGDSLNAM